MIIKTQKLGFQWQTADPFLFCVHHDDAYPAGNGVLGPDASLAGRNIGMDFEGIDGWRMYHGDVVPGFPHHPHRGFETITIARQGYIDHADSLGATGRFGMGDVQWMTAGKGIVHSEMFPLVKPDAPNPCELFQIWLNLPRANKMVEPHYSMLWHEDIPTKQIDGTTLTVIAGGLHGLSPLAPPPSSWAASADSHVSVWTLLMKPKARFTLPAATAGVNRTLYFFRGTSCKVDGTKVESRTGVQVKADVHTTITNGADVAEILVLQGKPIGEPVFQHGPFVMNSRQEILEAFQDYQRTEFGGWPWPSSGPVHARERGRFAKHADGRTEDK